jgi:hypothetical protein
MVALRGNEERSRDIREGKPLRGRSGEEPRRRPPERADDPGARLGTGRGSGERA